MKFSKFPPTIMKLGLTILVSMCASLICTLGAVLIFFHTPGSTWSWLFNQKEIALLEGLQGNTEYLTFKDLWAYQASLYELIITTLIGINAVIAILAFVYINVRSKQETREEARQEVAIYLKSDDFATQWKEKFNRDFSLELERLAEVLHRAEDLESELGDLRKDVKVISKQISEQDVAEQTDSYIILEKVK